jgi:UDP-3-O-[3-hydroxymyristoyl] glucosamine N-acyltransferase
VQIEQQQAKIRALKLPQSEKLCGQEQFVRVIHDNNYHKKRDIEVRKLARLKEKERNRVFFLQQEEQRRRDKEARDKSAMQAYLRHKAAKEVQKTRDRLRQEEIEGERLNRAIDIDER